MQETERATKEAIEKQIPKEPTNRQTIYGHNGIIYGEIGFCSRCNSKVNTLIKYCVNCGQKIKWD